MSPLAFHLVNDVPFINEEHVGLDMLLLFVLTGPFVSSHNLLDKDCMSYE